MKKLFAISLGNKSREGKTEARLSCLQLVGRRVRPQIGRWKLSQKAVSLNALKAFYVAGSARHEAEPVPRVNGQLKQSIR